MTRTTLMIALLVDAADPLQPVDQDPDAVREQACRIVSRDASVCSAPVQTAPPSGPSNGMNIDWLGTVLWIVLIAGLTLLLVLLVRAVAGRGSRGLRRRAQHVDDIDEIESATVAVDRSREPADWRAEADEHRRAGRFREALRCRYRALVGDLARRGLIDEIPGRTTGEERAQLTAVRPPAGGPFTTAADLFDEAWYGRATVDDADDERFQVLERVVLAASPPTSGVRE